jgi:hypothetical protein
MLRQGAYSYIFYVRSAPIATQKRTSFDVG